MAREMKVSGVEWIGEIPVDWNIKRNKLLFVEVNNRCENGNEHMLLSVSEYYGVAPKSEKVSDGEFETRAETLDGYKLCQSEDIVMNIMLAWKRSTGRSAYDGIVSPAYCVYRKKADIDTKYYHYLFRTDIVAELFKRYSTGIIDSRLRLYPDKFMGLNMIVPPCDEQCQIAEYLDQQCVYIDSVIEKTKVSIDEYIKLKQAIITRTVTKGVRGDREMKDSGIECIGQIPSNWDMRKIKYIFKIQKEIAGEEGHTVLSITQKGIKPKDLTRNEGQLAENYSNYQLVHMGDFAMNHMDLLTGWVDISKYEGVTSPDYRVFRLIDKDNYYSKYYLYLMQMCYTNRIFYGLGQGVSGLGRWRLQADKFLNFSITVPSYEEQEEIADYLDKKCYAIDDLIAKKEQYLSEIENYKKSLIYEYVTGKKEVPQEYQA
ncbi:MAG: restriction endonuclease subunit S [Lachnospiraceae bacterium]|nr:restriction endonuclease subunit S [Lachnospiraceae bacterium]